MKKPAEALSPARRGVYLLKRRAERMTLKAAEQLLEEMLRYVQPPPGVKIVLSERAPKSDGNPNWRAAMGPTGMPAMARFNEKVAKARGADPIVDWSALVAPPDGQAKQIAKRFSEVGQ